MAPLKSFDDLGRHIADQQDAVALAPSQHERAKSELVSRAFAGPRRRASWLIFTVAAVAAAGAALYLGSGRPLKCFAGSAQVPVAVGAWMSAANAAPLALGFSDGTRATLWPHARGRVTRLGSRGADMVVEQGRASFAVVHHDDSHWQVSTGPFAVQVTGTRFDVEWHPEEDHFELSLYEGHVRVSGCALGNGEELSAGQRVEASCARNEFRISQLSSEAAVQRVEASTGPNNERASSEAPRSKIEPTQTYDEGAKTAVQVGKVRAGGSRVTESDSEGALEQWLVLARAGRFADAYAAASALGFEAACTNRGAIDTLLLADAARLSGHVEPAMHAYGVVRRRWPGSRSAALAAFQMGRAEFDQLGDYGASEHWLRVYGKEQPDGEFAAPALGRLMEVELRLGHESSARELARTYLNRYPKGAHADAASRVLGNAATQAD